MVEKITNIIIEWGVNQDVALVLGWIAVILSIFILSVIANYITKKILLTGVTRLIKRTKTNWDDALLENKVFTRLSHIAPALVIYFTSTVFSVEMQDYIQRFSTVYMILTGLFVISAFFNAVIDIYRSFESSKQKPIKGYTQVAKIIIYVFVGIYAVGIVLNQSVLPILGGLGAMTAVILLVFKDSILGLVASIQLSGNDMVRIGDSGGFFNFDS